MLQAVHDPNSKRAITMPAIISTEDGFLGHQRMRELELRVNQTEQSNRALLEELARLQNDYRVYTKRTEQLLENEKQTLSRVEQTNQILQQKLSDLEERNRRADHEVNVTKSALAQLVTHTRGVERAVTSSQQDLINKKEQSLYRVTELNHLCLELKRQVDHESKVRTAAEQSLSSRISELTHLFAEQDRKREEMIRLIETRQRDFTSHTDADRYKIQHKIDQTLGVVTNNVSTVQSKLKQELDEKFYTLERQIASERENKLHDRSLRDELARRIHSSKKKLEDDVTAVFNKLDGQTKDIDVKIRELYKATNLLDQSIQHVREHSEQVIGAESKARKKSEKEIYRRLEESEDKVKSGLASLLDTVSSVKKDSSGKVTEIKPKIETLAFSHERLQKQIEEVQTDLRRLPREVSDLESRIERMDRGSANKNATKKVQDQIDKTQTSIRKLAESVQVVKNVLLDRIKEEETNRLRQTSILKSELLKLRSRFQETFE